MTKSNRRCENSCAHSSAAPRKARPVLSVRRRHLLSGRLTHARPRRLSGFRLARSKAFYLQALAPLGYVLVMEVQQDENDSPAAGFGGGGKPDFWIGDEGGLQRPIHIAIAAQNRAAVDAFYRAALAAGGKD